VKAVRWLVPRTLFGQITLIIIVGIACSQIVGFLISMREYQRGGSEFLASVMVDRVGSYTALFDSLRPQDRESIAVALSRPSFLLAVAADAVAPPELKEDVQALRSDLAARLGAGREVIVTASSEAINAEMMQKVDRSLFARRGSSRDGLRRESGEERTRPAREENWWSSMAAWLRLSPRGAEPDLAGRRQLRDPATVPLIQVRLADGGWLRFQSNPPVRNFSLSPFMVFNWILLLVAALAVSLFAARLATRPFKRLSNAAEGLSRDLNAQALEESGPAEAKEAARAFNRMHDRLANYLNSRSRMLMAMSHDLKTPLTRLRLRSELLDESDVSEKIKADLAEMETLVMTTLNYLRGSETREETKVVEMRALVSAMCADHPVWDGMIRVEEGPPLPVCVRPTQFRRALSNLLDNAVRYGARAEVTFAGRANETEISIRDFGPGIPVAEIENVFKPFVRLESSRNRETGGTGLGLTIAREIIEAHGGRIELVNSDPGLVVKLTLGTGPAGRAVASAATGG
jgi:signal transduction histidine kinase